MTDTVTANLLDLDRAGLVKRDVPTVHAATMGEAIDANDVRRDSATEAAQQRALAAPGGVRGPPSS